MNSLTNLFDNNKNVLVKQLILSGTSLKDEVSQLVGQFLKKLVEENKESLDYELTDKMILEFHSSVINDCYAKCRTTQDLKQPKYADKTVTSRINLSTKNISIIMIAICAGGVVGGLVFDSWIGSLIISAIVTFLSLFLIGRQRKDTNEETIEEDSLDIESVIQQTRSFCKSIDLIIETHYNQIVKIEEGLKKNSSKPFEEENVSLLEHIQSLIGYERYQQEEEDYQEGLKDRCEDLVVVLNNKGLSFVDYQEDNSSLFDVIDSDNIKKPVKAWPAIVKGNQIIMKGRVFVQKQ